MPKSATVWAGRERRRGRQDVATSNGRWRLRKDFSLDSILVAAVTIAAMFGFVYTLRNDIDKQAQEIKFVKEQTKASIDNVQKSVERVESDQRERSARVEKDLAERAVRLELAIKETNQLVQSVIVPRLQR